MTSNIFDSSIRTLVRPIIEGIERVDLKLDPDKFFQQPTKNNDST